MEEEENKLGNIKRKGYNIKLSNSTEDINRPQYRFSGRHEEYDEPIAIHHRADFYRLYNNWVTDVNLLRLPNNIPNGSPKLMK